jgi:hypothetical protein
MNQNKSLSIAVVSEAPPGALNTAANSGAQAKNTGSNVA